MKSKNTLRKKVSLGGAIRNIHDKFLRISDEAYQKQPEREINIEGYIYNPLLSTPKTAIYINEKDKRIIIGHRGTVPSDLNDLIADAAIMTGTFGFSNRLKESMSTVQNVIHVYPNFRITNTGHSLGGKVASEIGQRLSKDNSRVVAFNIGSTPLDMPKNLLNQTKCIFTNSSQCQKLKNQRIYSTGVDPISISSLTQVGAKVIRPRRFNVHSLKNFK